MFEGGEPGNLVNFQSVAIQLCFCVVASLALHHSQHSFSRIPNLCKFILYFIMGFGRQTRDVKENCET